MAAHLEDIRPAIDESAAIESAAAESAAIESASSKVDETSLGADDLFHLAVDQLLDDGP